MSNRDLTTRSSGRRGVAHPLRSLHDEIDRLFDDFGFGRSLLPRFAEPFAGELSPNVDLAETEKEVIVTAELPGIDEKDVDVTFADGVLTIRGEKKAEKEDKGKSFHRVERSYGAFSRAIGMPSEVDDAKVEAKFTKGVLTVTLPKKPAAQASAKKIAVKAG
jgi:HSP20 family protein